MMTASWHMFRRDLLLAWRRPGDAVNTLFFFVMVTTLFALAVGPEPDGLRAIAPGAVWSSALLASLLALPRLFASDHADGALETMLMAADPLPLLVLGKVMAHWITAGLPLALMSPLLALQFDLSVTQTMQLALSLLLGTPTLSLIGAIGAALTLGVRGGSMLLALLVLPLYIPVLIFGIGSTMDGIDTSAHFLILGSLLTSALALAPWASAAALRIALE